MPSWFGRDDWESVLDRWTQAGLVGDETAAAISAWEAERQDRASASRLVDALTYLGVSIVVIGVLMLVGLTVDDGPVWLLLPLAAALAAGYTAVVATRSHARALADAGSAAAVVLLSVCWALFLDEIGGDDQLSIGWALVGIVALFSGAVMARLTRSPLALMLAGAAVALLPFAIAIEGSESASDFFDHGLWGLAEWAHWSAFAATIGVGGALLVGLAGPRRWNELAGTDAPIGWARLGVSMGTAIGMVSLAASSDRVITDWMTLLAAVVITAWARRNNQVELLPAAALLLLGALAGGLSDLNAASGVALTLLVMLLLLELGASSLILPRVFGPLSDHWLVAIWEAALLVGGVAAAVILSTQSVAHSVIGLVWSLAVLGTGAVRQHQLALGLGLLGFYVSGTIALFGGVESTEAAIAGTLAFGIALVAAAVWWSRRTRASRVD
ncbi:MAG: hypothetical protein OXN87_07910 [Chloroflexota bacterium]|nr:hypothetical protein [Chloroflexota bacterium]